MGSERGGQRQPIDVLWTVVAVLVPVIVALVSKLGTVDLAYQLRAGDEILRSGSIPRVDTYTFTVSGQRWVDQQWGAQVLLELLHRLGGWPMLVVLGALLVGVSFWLINITCRGFGVSERTAALLTLGSFVMATQGLALRPQLFAVPLVCLVLWVTSSEQQSQRLFLVPLAAWACAMLHGAFVLIPLIAGLAWLEARRTKSPHAGRLLAATVASAVVTLATPLGVTVWTNAFELSRNPRVRNLVTEWRPTSLESVNGWFMLVSVLLIGGFLARRGRVTHWPALLTLAIFLFLALSAQRGVLWWAFVTPVVVAQLIGVQPQRRAEESDSWAVAVTVMVVLVLAVIVVEPFHRAHPSEVLLSGAPVALSAAVKDELPDGVRLLAYQPWASWIEYENPTVRVFLDTRFELLTDEVADGYVAASVGRHDWKAVLARWDVEAVAAPLDWDLVALLRTDSSWTVIHEDEDSVLFVRA